MNNVILNRSYPSWYPTILNTSHLVSTICGKRSYTVSSLSSSLTVHRTKPSLLLSSCSLVRIPIRHASSRFFDRLIPEDDPKTKEYKERERRVIKEQFQRGKLADAIKARTEKLYVAPPHVILPIPDNLFPNDILLDSIVGDNSIQSSSSSNSSKTSHPQSLFQSASATILTIAFQGHGQEQLVPWHEGIRQAYGTIPSLMGNSTINSNHNLPRNTSTGSLTSSSSLAKVQTLNILYLQGWFFKIFRNMIKKGTARSLDTDLLPNTQIVFEPSLQKTDHFCDKLKIHNRMMGYVYLIDQQGYIRWRAHAVPAPNEIENMVQAIKLLAPK